MGKREELLREHDKWTKIYIDADNRYKELLPKARNVTQGGKLEPWFLTEEKMAEIDRVEQELEKAKNELREIRDKLALLQRKPE